MPDFDPRTPSIARVYDYLLGGKGNFAADREAGDRLIAVFPAVVEAARENRQFIARAVTWVANQGVGQFIDLGCGILTAPNTHETAQAVRPGARVVYVESDAVALSHGARAGRTSPRCRSAPARRSAASAAQYHSLSVHSFHAVGLIGSIIGAWVLLLLLRLTGLEPGRRRY